MFKIFTYLADYLTYDLFKLVQGSKLGESIHFFIEDTTKILFLLVVMIYSIAWLRASLNLDAVRDYIKGKNRFLGYLIGSAFGAVTPFCSCSSIPLFLGFTSARIPVGVTMAFLITSPMINEVAIVLLGSLLGLKFTLIYVGLGISAGILGGFILDQVKADRYLKAFIKDSLKNNQPNQDAETGTSELKLKKMSAAERHEYAKEELKEIFGRVWKWVIIGVSLGSALHGMVPASWITDTFTGKAWWEVPAVVLVGIPLYTNASGMIPIAESLLTKGLPVGTTLAFMMSTIAASFPEFVMLKQVMEWKLLVGFFFLLLAMFVSAGWIFNLLWL